MKRSFLVFLILTFSISVFGFNAESRENYDKTIKTENENLQVNDDKAPAFTLTTTDGNELSLSDYSDKIVILDFWATWCPPCRKGIPDLIELQEEFNNEVIVIGISLDNEKTVNQVEPFIKNYGINYPVVYGNAEIVKDYGNIRSIPTSFIVDKDGNIVARYVGLRPKSTYVNEIEKLLKEL